jgi:hypothetical protein
MCYCPHFTDEESQIQCLNDLIKATEGKNSRDGCGISEGLTCFLLELIFLRNEKRIPLKGEECKVET